MTNVTEISDAFTKDKRTVRPGGLSTGERKNTFRSCGLNDKESQVEGSMLLYLLFDEANKQGLSYKDLAIQLGVTYGYLAQMKSGDKPITGVSPDFVARCSEFLGIPEAAVMVAARKLKIEQLYAKPENWKTELDAAMRYIASDPQFGPYMSPNTLNADTDTKKLLVKMYQEITGKVLIQGFVPLENYKPLEQPISDL